LKMANSGAYGAKAEAEDELDKTARGADDAGPPGFYDADLKKYYKKFDKSLKERADFKLQMKDSMTFTNLDWNQNVETQGTS